MFSCTKNKKKYSSTRKKGKHMWKVIWQMPIKAGCQDALLALQSRFPIVICNKSSTEAWLCLVSFSWLSLPHIFYSGSNWNGCRMMERRSCIFFRIITLFIKYKSDIVHSVFLSLDQILIKLAIIFHICGFSENERGKFDEIRKF